MTFVQFPAAGLVSLSHHDPLLLKYNNSDLMPHLRLASLSVVKERATTPGLASIIIFFGILKTLGAGEAPV
jgi:hypothetical protein